ncbi:hypothetical protein AAG906_038582 [Vitis piasezkii]
MVEPRVGLRAFQVPIFAPTLSVHSTVGSGVSSCYHRIGTMGVTIPLFISTVEQQMGWVIDYDNCVVSHRFPHDLDPLSMMARRGVASTSGSGKPQKSGRQTTRVGRLRSERPISKERRGHLVEWVDKASFTQLNKLFKINASKRAHKLFIIPIFPRLALPSLVPGEHFVLKDLPFYEVTRLVDSEAYHAHLEEWEKKLPPPVPVHLTIAAGITPESDEKIPSTNDIAHHELMRPFIGPYHFNDESFEYLVSSLPCPKSTYVPNEEEVSKLLRRIISFIERETLIQNMRVLFPATQRILVEIDNDPNYTNFETIEVFLMFNFEQNVRKTILSNCGPLSTTIACGTSNWHTMFF